MAPTTGHNTACAWFAEYLDGLRLEYEQDPDLGVTTTPDFVVSTGTGSLICEVKSFAPKPGLWELGDGQDFLVRDTSETLKPMRRQLREAAVQLRPMRQLGMPLIVVMADPLRTQVPLDLAQWAMFGDVTAVVSAIADGPVETMWTAGRNGKLRADHPYISAVMTLRVGSTAADGMRAAGAGTEISIHPPLPGLHDRSATLADVGAYYATTLIESISTECVPVPEGVFVGAHDRRMRLNADRTSLTLGGAARP